MGDGSSLCSYLQEAKSCPSREHGRLSACGQDLHPGTASHRLASNHCSGIWRVRDAAGEDINPSLTRRLRLADLPHPELKPQEKPKRSIPAKKTPARPRCRRAHGRPGAENPLLVFLAPPGQGEDASPASREGNVLPHSSARERERFSRQHFLKAGCSFQCQGRISSCCQLFTCQTQGESAPVTFTSGTVLLGSRAENNQPIREKWLLINKMWGRPCRCNKIASKQKNSLCSTEVGPGCCSSLARVSVFVWTAEYLVL